MQIAQAAPQAPVLVDEAYFEFHGETLMGASANRESFCGAYFFQRPTASPVCELAFLRETPGRWRWFAAWPRPTASTQPRSQFCRRRFTIRSMSIGYVAEVRRNRERLQLELGNLGLRYWPSHANFVLVRIGLAHAEFVRALRDRGILVRDRTLIPDAKVASA
jgi:histidinol-phosphate aminotransferase